MKFLDDNSELFFNSLTKVLKFLQDNQVPTRVVMEGNYYNVTNRQCYFHMCINDKYYIYFQGKYDFVPGKTMKRSYFSSIVLFDWNNPTTFLIHQHINTEDDVDPFLDELKKYI